jgi:hypothetical protein
MAPIQASERVRVRMQVRNGPVVERKAYLQSASPSPAQILGHFAQELLGIALILLGIGLVFTLVLMPIGLPIALVGIALLAAPSD